ncbi:hypothetical protein ACQ4PT_014822 [Festuca glaucescens]
MDPRGIDWIRAVVTTGSMWYRLDPRGGGRCEEAPDAGKRGVGVPGSRRLGEVEEKMNGGAQSVGGFIRALSASLPRLLPNPSAGASTSLLPHLLAPSGRARRKGSKMYTARKKIQKDKGVEPTETEETVAQALFDLENGNTELKSDLKDLYINTAFQLDIVGNRKAVVIHVPYRLRKAFKKIHVRLVRELEKKFSGKDVVFVATRKIVRPPKKGSAVQRPRTRTLTAVHDGILEDVVYPAEIVGKRIRYRLDGAKVIKIYLDPKERNNTEYKLETFSAVYRKLCGKEVVFEYPVTETA